MRIVQITDPHVTATGTLRAGVIDTGQRFKTALEHCRTLDPAPDLVLLTCDLADDARADEYAAIAAIVQALPTIMQGQPACQGADALADLLARHGGLIGSLSGHLHRAMAATYCGAASWIGPSTAYRLPLAQSVDDLAREAAERVCYSVHDWSPDTGLRSAEIVV